ncbi:MAG TPA: MFS transporter [Acidimicrobiia bacterium]|nr:MFS transporter [Acidimicrobiia bacterium]
MSQPGTRGTPNEGLTASTLGFFFGFAAVALFGPTAKEFKDLMGLTPAQVGLLVAAPSLSGSLLRIPFSAWVDTTGGRKPFLVLLGTSVVGMAGLVVVMYTAYPDNVTPGVYPVLLLLGVLSGSGIATFSVGISQVSYWFPQSRQGWALGTYAGAGNLAPGLFSFLLPLVLAGAGLPVAYVAWLGLLVIGTYLYWQMGQNAPYFQLRQQGVSADQARVQAARTGEELFPAGTARQTLAISARNWKTWALVVLYFTTFGGFIALTAWLPTYWREFHGASAFAAGTLTAVFSLLASVLRIVGGSIADRIGGESTAIVSLTLLLAGATVMMFSDGLVVSVLAEIVMAAGMGVNNAAVFKLVPQEVPEAVGGAAGWVGGLGAFGGFAVPPLMGTFVRGEQLSGYATGFVVLVVLALVSLAVAYWLRRHARHPQFVPSPPTS